MRYGLLLFLPAFLVVLIGPSVAGAALVPGFLPNRGEFPPEVLCYGTVGPATAFLTSEGIVLDLHAGPDVEQTRDSKSRRAETKKRIAGHVVRVGFSGPGPFLAASPIASLTVPINRYHGRDPARWQVGVRPWSRLRLDGTAPDCGLVVAIVDDALVVEPSTDSQQGDKRPGLQFEGSIAMRALENGGFSLETTLGPVLIQPGPSSGWRITPTLRKATISQSDNGKAAQTRAPASILWSTYLGGNDMDRGRGLALDADDNPVVVGQTFSQGFPTTPGAYDTTTTGDDGFVARLDGRTGWPYWVTLLGGDSTDRFFGLAVSPHGQAVVSGWTESLDYPTTPGSYDETLDASWAAMITKLDLATGALVWSTLLERAYGWSIALTSDDCPVIAGSTTSAGFIATPGAFDVTYNGDMDAIVAKLSADGSQLLWSTYLGCPIYDRASVIAIDDQDHPVIGGVVSPLAGQTAAGFPVTLGAYDVSENGVQDPFVAVLSGDGADLVWCSYLGGSDIDLLHSLAVDEVGNVLVAGVTTSPDFPVTNGEFPWTPDTRAGIVAKLSSDGQTLLASRLLGGGTLNEVSSVMLGAGGSVVLCGRTWGPTFPIAEEVTPEPVQGNSDAFVVVMDGTLTDFKWFTLLGGTGFEVDNCGARARDGRLFLAGETGSADFPLTEGAYDTVWELEEAYAACLSAPAVPVFLREFRAAWVDGHAVVQWRIEDEMGMASLGLYRQAGLGVRVLVCEIPLTGQGSYDVIDVAAEAGQDQRYWLRELGSESPTGWYGPAELSGSDLLPGMLVLNCAQPNPFNPTTTIRFSLPEAGRARVLIYDQQGRLVRTLTDADLPAGEHEVDWDGRSDRRQQAPSGTYIVRLVTEGGTRTSKAILVR